MLGDGLQTPPLRFPIYRDLDTQTFLETYGQTRVRGQETLAQRGCLESGMHPVAADRSNERLFCCAGSGNPRATWKQKGLLD